MISYEDLVFNPDQYNPLSSHKSVYNKANVPDFTKLDIETLFRSKPNRTMLARSLYRININNGGVSNLDKFVNLIPVAQNEFCMRNDISQYQMAEEDSDEIRDWAELLRVVNNNFTKFCYNYLKWNHFNPFRAKIDVGPLGNRTTKKYSDLLAADIPTIDIYGDYNIERNNKQFWLENKIPTWRASIHTRHLERDNDGLRNGNPDRASLEVFQRGFNMEKVESLIDKWHSKNWWGT
jgi:hypothetical protein